MPLTITCRTYILLLVMKMARTVREKCESNIYHVMLRGINRQRIFQENEDYQRFTDMLVQCRDLSKFQLYAWCLMGNHVHLLLRADEEPLEQVMKRIGTRYAVWYNKKYSRTGHLFQDRFRSEPVTDNAYFLTVLRYIHNNPVKAGISMNAESYPWSSAADYAAGEGMTDIAFAEELAGREALLEYLRETTDEICMDETPPKANDRVAQNIIREIVGDGDMTCCVRKIADHPERYIRLLRNAGLSIRQISRLTGLSIGIVRK